MGQQHVGEFFRRQGAVQGEGLGQPGQAPIDVFAAAFDEPVGVDPVWWAPCYLPHPGPNS